MQIYFHSRLCSYLPRVPILVEGTVNISIYLLLISALKGVMQCLIFRGVTIHRYIDTMYDVRMHRCHA